MQIRSSKERMLLFAHSLLSVDLPVCRIKTKAIMRTVARRRQARGAAYANAEDCNDGARAPTKEVAVAPIRPNANATSMLYSFSQMMDGGLIQPNNEWYVVPSRSMSGHKEYDSMRLLSKMISPNITGEEFSAALFRDKSQRMSMVDYLQRTFGVKAVLVRSKVVLVNFNQDAEEWNAKNAFDLLHRYLPRRCDIPVREARKKYKADGYKVSLELVHQFMTRLKTASSEIHLAYEEFRQDVQHITGLNIVNDTNYDIKAVKERCSRSMPYIVANDERGHSKIGIEVGSEQNDVLSEVLAQQKMPSIVEVIEDDTTIKSEEDVDEEGNAAAEIIHDCQILPDDTLRSDAYDQARWKMTKIYRKSELDKDEPVVCSGKDCKLLAVARWESVDNQNEWVACLDCQEK